MLATRTMKELLSSLAGATALIGLLNSSPNVLAANTTKAADHVEVKNLVGTWTNELKTVLTITSVEAKSGGFAGSYRLAYSGAGGAVRLTGWANTKGMDPKDANLVKSMTFSAHWGAHGAVRTWKGFYTVIEGEDVILGRWVVPREDDDPILGQRLNGEDRFHRQGQLRN